MKRPVLTGMSEKCLHLCSSYVQILQNTKGLCMGLRKIYSVTKYIIKMFDPYESKGRKVLGLTIFIFVVSWLFFFCEMTRIKWMGALRGSERTRGCPLSLSVSVDGVSWGWPLLCPLSFTSPKGAALHNAEPFDIYNSQRHPPKTSTMRVCFTGRCLVAFWENSTGLEMWWSFVCTT